MELMLSSNEPVNIISKRVKGVATKVASLRPQIASPAFFIGKSDDQLISFGSGQPDLSPPEEIQNARLLPTDFMYSEIQGYASLRERLEKKHLGFHRNGFIITNGASEAFDLIMRVLARNYKKKNLDHSKKGKVLLPRPYYYSYTEIVELAGLQCVFYPLVEGRVEMDVFKSRLKGCVAAVVNSPSNPLGSIQQHDLISEMELACDAAGAVLVSDEVYDELDDSTDALSYKSGNTIAINSFSKTFSLCGMRVGYAYGKNHAVIAEMVEAKTHSSMNTCNFSQRLALLSLDAEPKFLANQHNIWRDRREKIYSKLLEMGLQPIKPEGAFYIFVKFRNAQKVLQDLYYDYKVIVYSGRWFGVPEHLRLSYALSDKKMEEGLNRLADYCRHVARIS